MRLARSRNKGQIPQLFIFLMAVLVIGATIYLGTKLIGGITSTACSAAKVDFTKQIKSVLDENSAFGTRNVVSVATPCDATALCFVNAETLDDPAGFTGKDSIITTSVRNKVRTNIFLQGRDATVPAPGGGYDERIAIDPANHDLCIPAVSGKFSFRIDSNGRRLTISGAT